MKPNYRNLFLLVATCAIVASSACSNTKSVGEGLETDLNEAINELSTTSVPGASTTAPPVANVGETTTTAAPRGQTTVTTARGATTLPPDRVVVVTINADTSGKSPFDPPVVQASVGTPVVFRNLDSKMRWVLSANGGWRSPELQPGQEWPYRPTQVGNFELKDGTRPYVTGTLQVY